MDTNLNGEQIKTNTGRGIILFRRFFLKVIINERKILTHHEIIDRIAQQIMLVITQVCEESKLWIHSNLRRPSFSFTYSFKFIYFCILDV